MQFLKKNYEKVLLAVVIILALGILAFLPILVSQDKEKLENLLSQVIDKPPKPLRHNVLAVTPEPRNGVTSGVTKQGGIDAIPPCFVTPQLYPV